MDLGSLQWCFVLFSKEIEFPYAVREQWRIHSNAG